MHTHNTQQYGPSPSQREEFDVGLLPLHESWKDKCDTAAERNSLNLKLRGLYCPGRL